MGAIRRIPDNRRYRVDGYFYRSDISRAARSSRNTGKTALLQPGGNPFSKCRHVAFYSATNFDERRESKIVLSTFDPPNVAPVQPGFVRQTFLRHSQFAPPSANTIAENIEVRVHRTTSRGRGLSIHGVLIPLLTIAAIFPRRRLEPMIGTIVAYFLGGAFIAAPIALGIWIDRRSGRVVWSGWRAEFAEIGSAVSELASGLLQLAGGLIALAILGILGVIALSALGWLASLSVPILLVGVALLLFLILLALITALSQN